MQLDISTTKVVTALITHLHLKKSLKARREARVEWLNIKDNLSVEQNAHYMDTFNRIDEQNARLRDLLRGHEAHITAQLN